MSQDQRHVGREWQAPLLVGVQSRLPGRAGRQGDRDGVGVQRLDRQHLAAARRDPDREVPPEADRPGRDRVLRSLGVGFVMMRQEVNGEGRVLLADDRVLERRPGVRPRHGGLLRLIEGPRVRLRRRRGGVRRLHDRELTDLARIRAEPGLGHHDHPLLRPGRPALLREVPQVDHAPPLPIGDDDRAVGPDSFAGVLLKQRSGALHGLQVQKNGAAALLQRPERLLRRPPLLGPLRARRGGQRERGQDDPDRDPRPAALARSSTRGEHPRPPLSRDLQCTPRPRGGNARRASA